MAYQGNIPDHELHDHSFLGEELLIPMVNHSDGGRINMFTQHQSQLTTINHGEPPLVFTRFEKQIGKYSSGHRDVDEKVKIKRIFEFNDNRKLILVYYPARKEYDIIEFNRAVNLTEYYGYQSILNDEVKEGAVIEPDGEKPWIFRNNMFDDDLNLCYGLNLNAVYIPLEGLTYEDPCVISESTAKKFSHTEVKVYRVVLNRNDVLINLLGDSDHYIPFTKIGEKIKDGILCAVRRIDYSTIVSDFKDKEFCIPHPNDDTIYNGNGTLMDIKVYSNIIDDSLPYNKPILDILAKQFEVYSDILEVCTEIKNSGKKVTDDFNHYLQKARDHLSIKDSNSNIPFSQDKSTFEGIVIEFIVAETKPCNPGDKLTGRYGNKGVISQIRPDNEMPKVESTDMHADICLNFLGVCGRMNISQLFEQELNFIADNIRFKYIDDPENKSNLKKFFKDLKSFYEIASPELLKYIDGCDLDDVKELLVEFIKYGIPIHQPPFFGNVNHIGLEELYNRFPTEKYKFEGIQQPLIMGKLYFVKLKHMPKGKFSVRSAEMTNLMDVPFRNNESYKKHSALFNSNAIKLGEQEAFNLNLIEDPETIAKFYKSYSSSRVRRQDMLHQAFMAKSPDDIESFNDNIDEESGRSNPSQSVRALLKGAGMTIIDSDDE